MAERFWLNLWNVKIYVHIKTLLQSFLIMALTHNCLLLSSPESLATNAAQSLLKSFSLLMFWDLNVEYMLTDPLCYCLHLSDRTLTVLVYNV